MPFQPDTTKTHKMSVTATSSNIAISPSSPQVRVVNTGSQVAYVEIGNGSGLAAVNSSTDPCSYPILPGAGSIPVLIDKGAADHLAAVCDAGQSTTLLVSTGAGDGVG